MSRPLPLAVLSAAFGLAIGVGLGVWLTPNLPQHIAQKASVHSEAAPTSASHIKHAAVANAGELEITINADTPQSSSSPLDIMPKTAPTNFEQAWADTSDKKTRFEQRWARAILMSQWAEKDPQAALAFLRDNIKGHKDADAVSALYMVFAERDLDGAIASLDTWKDHHFKLQAKASILQIMSETDPFGAVDLWLEVEPRGFSQEVTYAAYLQDAQRFLNQVDQLPREKRIHAMDSLVAAMSQEDPQAALNIALNEHSLNARNRMLNTILRKVGEEDAYAAIRIYQGLPESANNLYAIRQVLGTLAAKDPEAALAFARETDDFNQNNLRTVLSNMAQEQPERAWKIAMEESGSMKAQSMAVNVFNQILNRDPEMAQRLLADISNDHIQQQCQQQMLNQLARKDPQSALDFAFEVGDADLEKHAVNSVVNQLTRDDPKLALEFAMENRDLASDNAVSNALQHWFKVDEEAGYNWLNKLPDDARRAELGADVAQRLAYQNPDLAESLMQRVDIDADKQPQITRYIAQAYLRVDTDKALTYSLQQDDPKLQYAALESVFTQWKNYNAEAARQTLSTLSVDDEIREKLLAKFE